MDCRPESWTAPAPLVVRTHRLAGKWRLSRLECAGPPKKLFGISSSAADKGMANRSSRRVCSQHQLEQTGAAGNQQSYDADKGEGGATMSIRFK